MNVIRFDIEISFVATAKERLHHFLHKRPWLSWIRLKNALPSRPPIKDFICKQFEQNSSNSDKYKVDIQNKWDGLQSSKMKSLYSKQYILGALNVSNIECFVFHSDNISIRDKITLEVVVLSRNENIDHSVSVVFEEIERQLSGCDVKALVDNFVFLFPYDRKGKDIWDAEYRIRANFARSTLTPQEVWRAAILAGVIILLATLQYFGDFSSTTISVFIAIYCSCSIFLLTEVFLKYGWPHFVRGRVLSVAINNLSTVVDDPPMVPYAEDSSPSKLQNPPVPR
jgi:hypothetical protein